jgi:hypothetical protein
MSSFDELYDVVMEANAYNKWANNVKDAYDREGRIKNNFLTIADNSPRAAGRATKRASLHGKTQNFISHYMNAETGGYMTPYDYKKRGSTSERVPTKNGSRPYPVQNKDAKKAWMQKHGDVGTSPEERYKAGRYLDLQKDLKGTKESVDDIRLEIYESCRYGDISEEDRDLLLEMI